jgi:hypothetical protein
VVDVINQTAKLKAWIRAHADLPTFSNRLLLYKYVNETCCGGGPVDYLEFGVAAGESMRHWTQVNTHPESRFVGFDTFEGLPEYWYFDLPKGSLSQQGKIPQMGDPRVSFHKGLFQETLPGFLQQFRARSKLVIHHDSDLYSSTLYCLTKLDDLCTKGTVLVFDEFASPLHEFRAYEDYLLSYRRALRPTGGALDRHGDLLTAAFAYD